MNVRVQTAGNLFPANGAGILTLAWVATYGRNAGRQAKALRASAEDYV